MDKAIHTVAPYFDPGELREELATVANAAGDATEARGIITDRLKSLVDEARNAVNITATARLTGRTGVEMEALTAVSVAALTVYDMCKAADRGMRIVDIRLIHKAGGKSGEYRAA